MNAQDSSVSQAEAECQRKNKGNNNTNNDINKNCYNKSSNNIKKISIANHGAILITINKIVLMIFIIIPIISNNYHHYNYY